MLKLKKCFYISIKKHTFVYMNVVNRWHVIVNPAAGNWKAQKKWDDIFRLLGEAGIEFDYTISTGRGDATDIAQRVVKIGYRKIIGVGGDGTNNEILNGIMRQKAVPSGDVIYATIPVGTGNDWIRTHRIPKNTRKAIGIIRVENTIRQDVGLVSYLNDGQQKARYFMNVAGMSYDAICTKASEDRGIFASNKILYLYLLFSCLRGFVAPRGRVFFDEKIDEDNYYLINVGICRYSGGGMQLVPHSIPDDGLFALTLARDLSKPEVIKATPILYNGKAGKHPKVDLYHAKSIRVESAENEQILLEVDGEFLGGTPSEFTLLEKAFRVVVP